MFGFDLLVWNICRVTGGVRSEIEESCENSFPSSQKETRRVAHSVRERLESEDFRTLAIRKGQRGAWDQQAAGDVRKLIN